MLQPFQLKHECKPLKEGKVVFSIVIIKAHIFGANWFFYVENPSNSF